MKTYKVTVDNDGATRWFNEAGQLHREDGPDGALPAIEHPSGHKEYYKNGQLHREDGPAIECIDGNKYYWLNNRRHSYEEWLKLTAKAKELTVKQISDLLGYDVKIVKD